jgi:hypothetical protein
MVGKRQGPSKAAAGFSPTSPPIDPTPKSSNALQSESHQRQHGWRRLCCVGSGLLLLVASLVGTVVALSAATAGSLTLGGGEYSGRRHSSITGRPAQLFSARRASIPGQSAQTREQEQRLQNGGHSQRAEQQQHKTAIKQQPFSSPRLTKPQRNKALGRGGGVINASASSISGAVHGSYCIHERVGSPEQWAKLRRVYDKTIGIQMDWCKVGAVQNELKLENVR